VTAEPGGSASIRLYDTLSAELRPLQPREPGVVRMYTCGPTVYNFTHIGHLRPAMVADTLVRHLKARGYTVHWITNFTDVDDKIIARAAEEGVPPSELAQRYIDDYLANMRALDMGGVERYVRVTEHIPEIVAMVRGLVEGGFAYAVDGDVYFAVEAKADYGKLAKRSLAEMQAGARVAVDPRKRHPMDFALWKAAKPGEPSWESPWGRGRPGWHIECSALSLHYLGEDFDVHGGGSDLIFPHHENELAQSEAYSGKPFVRIWLHNAMVQVDQQKMSKSLGNFVPLHELVAAYPPAALRLFMLGTHYRKPLQYSKAALDEAARALARLRAARIAWRRRVAPAAAAPGTGPLAVQARRAAAAFDAALDDDLNTAGALGQLFDLVRAGNAALAAGAPAEDLAVALEVLEAMGERFGLWLEPVGEGAARVAPAREVSLVQMLVALRAEARAYRDFSLADRIRDGLQRVGVVLEDEPTGTRWRWADAPGDAGDPLA
jgi:cysteinyl-tRNA synthetase